MVMSDKVKGALIYILGTLSVATVVLLFSTLLSGCTTSTQARNAQKASCAMLGVGLATFTAGQIISHNATQESALAASQGDYDPRAQRSHTQTIRNGGYTSVAGGALVGAGLWTLIISSIQLPFLEYQEESRLRRAELEIIESSFP